MGNCRPWTQRRSPATCRSGAPKGSSKLLIYPRLLEECPRLCVLSPVHLHAPHLIGFHNVIRKQGALVHCSAILVHQILQKTCNECPLLSTTCSHYPIGFPVVHQMEQQLIQISF